ncbi:MAG: universal stress protein [Thermoleophilia bacterium]|nr:universal stress protein [Thermoleophilia bacterium]
MIKSLLLAVDSSAHARSALEHAVEVAAAYQARVTGLYVLDIRYLEMPPYLDYSYAFEAVPPTLAPLDVMDKFKVKSERILSDVREVVQRAGLEVETRTEEGVPGQVIADVGDTHDLVVMGKRGEHAKWGRDLLGSTAEAVVRVSASPVLLTEEAARPVKKALVLFDGSHPAKRGLKLACDIAERGGVSLRVLTVDDDEQRGRETLDDARAYLEPLGVEAGYSVLPGRPAKAAAASLAEEPADLVILGMRGYSSLRKLILGRTAELVMRSIELPVLMVP